MNQWEWNISDLNYFSLAPLLQFFDQSYLSISAAPHEAVHDFFAILCSLNSVGYLLDLHHGDVLLWAYYLKLLDFL